jgi:hypothetical protein
MRKKLTFHVAFSFIDYESIAPATALFVANYSYSFDCTIGFKFATKISLCGAFVLKRGYVSEGDKLWVNDSHTRREIKSVL